MSRWKASTLTLAISAVSLSVVGTSQSFKSCIHNHKNDKAYEALEDKAIANRFIARKHLQFDCAGETVDTHNAVVMAIATAFIAAFTIVLAGATRGLAGATRGLKVSADEQIAETKALRGIAETQNAISSAQTDIFIRQKEISRQQSRRASPGIYPVDVP
jgi:hypothetical protein